MNKMQGFLKVVLLGALLAMILDTTYGVYDACGYKGVCVGKNYPICYTIKGKCKQDERCCKDWFKIYDGPSSMTINLNPFKISFGK